MFQTIWLAGIIFETLMAASLGRGNKDEEVLVASDQAMMTTTTADLRESMAGVPAIPEDQRRRGSAVSDSSSLLASWLMCH